MKLIFSFLVLCHLLTSNAYPQPKKYKKIQHIIDEATKANIPGVVIYIKTPKDGEWTGVSGLADLEKKVPMDKGFVFATGSIGKMYNAVAAMKLTESGKLHLDDLISRFLPEEIVSNIPNGRIITVRHLLSNTSGIYNYEFDPTLNDLYLDGKLRLDTLSHLNVLRRYVYGKPSTGAPGSHYNYSSTNFMLLAMIMDSVCPEGHTDFLRKIVLEAEGFNSTFYRTTAPGLVNHYGDLNKDGVLENLTAMTVETTNWFIGDDGIYASITDAAHFLESLMKAGIVSKASLDQMTTWNDAKKPDYGLGLMADKSFPYKFLIGHSGRGIGMTTDLFYFPNQNMTVGIFCNVGIRGSSDQIKKAYLRMRSKVVKKLFLF
ncbi:MAG TPA: serine hydrolase domain-containing protein [Chryseolinea sp.]